MTTNSKLLRSRFRPLLAIFFLFFTNFFYLLFSNFENGHTTGKAGDSLGYQILFIATYGVLSYKLVRSWAAVLDRLVHSLAFLFLIESALISFLLVGVEMTSVIRFSLYIGTILAGLFVAVTYEFDDVVTTYFWTSALFLIVHFMLFPFLYNAIIYDDLYLDRTTLLGTTSYGGLFSKESAGEAFALSSIVAFPRCFQGGTRWTARLILAGSLLAVLLVGAMGPLVSLILAFGIAIQIQGLYSKHKTIAFVSIPSTICLALIFYYLVGIDQLLGLFNRSANFTGRDILFQLWPKFFAEHPIFGYGFNGFFNGLPGSPEEQLSNFMPDPWTKFVTWESSYIEILIQLGIVGGILYFFIFLKAFSNAFYLSNYNTSESRYVPITMLLFMLFGGIAECTLMLQNTLLPLLLFWIYFGCGERPATPRRTAFSSSVAAQGSRRWNEFVVKNSQSTDYI